MPINIIEFRRSKDLVLQFFFSVMSRVRDGQGLCQRIIVWPRVQALPTITQHARFDQHGCSRILGYNRGALGQLHALCMLAEAWALQIGHIFAQRKSSRVNLIYLTFDKKVCTRTQELVEEELIPDPLFLIALRSRIFIFGILRRVLARLLLIPGGEAA